MPIYRHQKFYTLICNIAFYAFHSTDNFIKKGKQTTVTNYEHNTLMTS